MAPITPNSRTWTLRLKHHRTTILLHADPIQKLSSLRTELLLALRETNPSGELDGYKIPQNADEIILAKPLDINDLSAGWERLEQKASFADDTDASTPDGKGKGKAKAAVTAVPGAGAGAKGKAGANKLTDCPQAVGLRDGGIVAFRFRSEDVEAGSGKDGVEEGFEMLEEDKREEAEKWDVVVPTIEETYAEEDGAAIREG